MRHRFHFYSLSKSDIDSLRNQEKEYYPRKIAKPLLKEIILNFYAEYQQYTVSNLILGDVPKDLDILFNRCMQLLSTSVTEETLQKTEQDEQHARFSGGCELQKHWSFVADKRRLLKEKGYYEKCNRDKSISWKRGTQRRDFLYAQAREYRL